MSKKMVAVFSDEAYAALKSGAAVDNNGFRSCKGNYYPDQPTFHELNTYSDQIKQAGTVILINCGMYIAKDLVLPFITRFTNEKIYPFCVKKWDEWISRGENHTDDFSIANAMIREDPSVSNECKIVNIDAYRKGA